MKPNLLILSDLWGSANADWTKFYIENLQTHFNISYYDVRELGELKDYKNISQSEIHTQFIEFGIENAVHNLLKIKPNILLNILAFSIGGTIAWKTALLGLKVKNMYLISSTRLRYEVQKPNCKIHLFYGEKDIYKPCPDWCEKMELKCEIVNNAKHELYRENSTATSICKRILQESSLH